MNKLVLCLLAANALAITITEAPQHPPETHFGDPAIACHPGASGTTGGFGTFFSDNQYAC